MGHAKAARLLAFVVLMTLGLGPAVYSGSPPPIANASAVSEGHALSIVGDCAICHTQEGSKAYAGGRPLKTPFGVVYSTNITPDAQTGIGAWTLADFQKAMRQGTAPGGRQLYPAFPYDHFTELTDADIQGLYMFLKQLPAVKAEPRSNRLIFPLGFRPVLLGWKLLFLKSGPLVPDPERSAEWNRGRYLSETVGHCGACHTPRNLFGAEIEGRAYSGGWSDGWYAPPLGRGSPAATPWTADALFAYLRTGLSLSHAAAAGPMGPVAHELALAPQADVRAIAVYIASLAAKDGRPPADQARNAAAAHPLADATFTGACETCHGEGAPMMAEGRPNLSLGTPLHEDNPQDTAQIILQGLKPPVGRAGPYMPSFASSLTDPEVADLLAYLRARYTKDAPWSGDLVKAVAKARTETAS